MASLAALLWFVNMLVDTGGQLSFKAAASHGVPATGPSSWKEHWKNMAVRPWLWIGIGCYIGEFFVWMAFLSQVELSAGIMLGCFNIVVIMLAGRLLFNEKLTPWRVAGILLITGGVAVIGFGGAV
jgi:drug/metabolite transporter (DMT)-like permease